MPATINDPFIADYPGAVTINSVVYTVTDFSVSGSDSGTDLVAAGGDYKGAGKVVKGKESGTITIQVSSAADVTPPVTSALDYRGSWWRMLTPGRSATNGPGTITIPIEKLTAAEVAALSLGTATAFP
jgi:hypothetical protein